MVIILRIPYALILNLLIVLHRILPIPLLPSPLLLWLHPHLPMSAASSGWQRLSRSRMQMAWRNISVPDAALYRNRNQFPPAWRLYRICVDLSIMLRKTAPSLRTLEGCTRSAITFWRKWQSAAMSHPSFSSSTKTRSCRSSFLPEPITLRCWMTTIWCMAFMGLLPGLDYLLQNVNVSKRASVQWLHSYQNASFKRGFEVTVL